MLYLPSDSLRLFRCRLQKHEAECRGLKCKFQRAVLLNAGQVEEDDESWQALQWMLDPNKDDWAQGSDAGILSTDGDGTVPLISMGLMCRHPQGYFVRVELAPYHSGPVK